MTVKRALKIGSILGRGFAVSALAFGISGLPAAPAHALDDGALPSGGNVAGGSAALDYSTPDELHVYQSSDRAIIDWSSFNIGSDALTQFHQPSSSSMVVNRVFGGTDPTQILGTLKANGIVIVLDQNGVIFGEGSRVDVGGIIASTGTIDSAAFMDSGVVHLSDITSGAIINNGTISVADAGLAAFVAPTVINNGTITAKLGRIQLASGESATLDLYGDGLMEVAISDADVQQKIINTGTLRADGGVVQMSAAAAKDVVNSVINIEGIVSASSATVDGGKIILGAGTVNVAQDAVLDASSTAGDGGQIIINAGNTAYIAGTIKATGSAQDKGGFIETSATDTVTIADTAHIDSGGGTWLIDPTNFTIADVGGDITTATLAAQLALNNITIETADAGGDAGDIFVNNALTWTSDKTLNLKAHRNIEVNAAITNTNGGSLLLRADKNGTGTGTVNFSGPGAVSMTGGGRTDLYYNPASYAAPTNYAGNMTGPYTAWMLVNNVTNLQTMNTNLAGTYALGKDIDASDTVNWNAGAGFNPVGTTATKFTGKFDGLGHTITGLTINRPTTGNVGLFGYTNGAAIKNVGLLGGSITGQNSVGSLVGYANGGTITNSYATGTVSGTDSIGGLIGNSGGASAVSNSYATGNVIGNNLIGGLIGYMSGGSTTSGSYATGDVSSVNGDRVGGLVGYVNQSTISNSYATGNIIGNDQTGGLVGYNWGGVSMISYSYSSGMVTVLSGNGGGLVGRSNNGASVNNSYWNIETSGQATSSGGMGLTSAQMMNMASFSGWDISDEGAAGTVWRIYEDQTAPLLSSFLTALTISAADVGVTYDGTAFSGGSVTYTGFKTGDDESDLLGTLGYGGTAQGAVNAGTYSITLLGGLYSGQQGYDISYAAAPATLTINTPPIIRTNLPVDAMRIINTQPATSSDSAATGNADDGKLKETETEQNTSTQNASEHSGCLASFANGPCLLGY